MTMKTLENGRISLSFGTYSGERHTVVNISIEDRDASITFAEVELTAVDFADLLASRSDRPCKITVRNLKNVGKTMERGEQLVFVVPKDMRYERSSDRKDDLIKLAEEACPEGWLFSSYFGSQDSFFSKDGVTYAQTNTYRWIDKVFDDDKC